MHLSEQPAVGKSGAAQPAADIRALPYQFPNQPRAIVLDHQNDDPLVEPEIALGDPAGWPIARQSRVESARQSRILDHFWIARAKMAQRRQSNFRREWQRREYRTRVDGTVIGPIRHTARGIAEKTAFPTVDLQCLETGPLVCRDTPTVLAIAFKPERITPCVFALHIRGAPAVFEIVALFLAHEEIAYAGKIDPGLRKMVNEERPRIKKFVIVDIFPLIGRGPADVAALRKRMGRRCQTQNIENDRLIIAIPAIMQKSALRLPSLPH